MDPRALERISVFTDAAVAIGMTLLVLPLVDVISESREANIGELMSEHAPDFFAFALSFYLVTFYWNNHRKLFDLLERLDAPLISLNFVWLFGVVFLPVPTGLLTSEALSASGVTVLYVVNLFFISFVEMTTSIWVFRHPALQRPDVQTSIAEGIHGGVTACIVMMATAVAAIFLAQFALFIMLLQPVVARAARGITQKVLKTAH